MADVGRICRVAEGVNSYGPNDETSIPGALNNV